MPIRKINSQDLGCISLVCIDAFMASVAPTLQEKGIITFRSIASIEGLKSRMDEDNEMLVYEENDGVIGFIELKEGRHIAMLFVSPGSQKKGVGQSLLAAVLPYAKSNVITVSASLTSIPAYLRFGFIPAGEVSESAGLTFQPMELRLNN